MALSPQAIRDLTADLADRLYIQIGGWHLYLGDASLAEPLAIECAARLDQGAAPGQLQDLEDLLEPYSR